MTLACIVVLALSSRTAKIGTSGAKVLNVSDGEADFIYYRAKADLGAAAAGRLWSVDHRLRSRCSSHPALHLSINVEPRVKAFLEAYR